ncbi:MAG: hypothetical protein U0T84_01930 [Chitinophagales bacterium]
MTRLYALMVLALAGTITTNAQTSYSSSLYGSGSMNNNQIDFAYTAKSGWNGYILSGADNLRQAPGAPMSPEVAPPQARIFKIVSGHVVPVWEAQQAVSTLAADSNKSFQQLKFEYSPSLHCFVNIFDPQNSGQDHHRVQLFDTAFHLIADIPAAIQFAGDIQFEVAGADTFAYSFVTRNYGYSIVKRRMESFERFNEVWTISTQADDTVQTQLRTGSCVAESVSINANDYFRPSSLSGAMYGDSTIMAVAERNTSLVRVWIGKDGACREFARIGGSDNTFNTETWMDGAMSLSAISDFQVVNSWGTDSICVTIYAQGGCSSVTAKGLLCMWYPASHQIRVLQQTDLGLLSNNFGSYRVATNNIGDMNSILNAPKLACFGTGQGRPGSGPGDYPGYFPINNGGQIDLRVPGDATPIVAINYTNLMNWSGKLRVASASAVPYMETDIRQPYIQCNSVGDSILLTVTGMATVDAWNTTDEASTTLMVPANVDAWYMCKGKTSAEMFGTVYSGLVEVQDGSCVGRSTAPAGIGQAAVAPTFIAVPNPSSGKIRIVYSGKDTPIITNKLGEKIEANIYRAPGGYYAYIDQAGVYFVITAGGTLRVVIV